MDLRLSTPSGAPYQYDVLMAERGPADGASSRCEITLTERSAHPSAQESAGRDRARERKSGRYTFRKGEHDAYLDLFAELAEDFGLRRPLNRQPGPEPSFAANYRPLLTTNLTPGIRYGYGDPAVLRVVRDGSAWYYLVCTSNDAPDAFPILRSQDLQKWEHIGFVFPQAAKPVWALDGVGLADFWAPELHAVGSEYRVYFVARHRDTRELCVGEARSSRPDGPFVAGDEPILRGDKIDPHLFVDDDRRAYLYWKEDSNGVWPGLLLDVLHRSPSLIGPLFPTDADRRAASLVTTLWPWIQTIDPMDRFFAQQPLIEAVTSAFADFERRLAALAVGAPTPEERHGLQGVLDHTKTRMFVCALSEDGRRVEGAPVRVLENDQPWEAHVVEGLWVLKHEGRYVMFYAGNDFSTAEYGINVAVADSPRGPFRKSPEPFLRSTADWSGPGHPSVAVGPGGEYVLFFHAFPPGAAGYKRFRALLCAPFTFDGEFPRRLI